MASSDNQELLARSIRVVNLPVGFNSDNVLNNLKNAGNIESIKLGTTEMIVTYSSSDERDLSKMYDGCSIEDYTIKLEDPTTLEVNSNQNHSAEQLHSVEAPVEHKSEPEQRQEHVEEPYHESQEPAKQQELAAPQDTEPHNQEPVERSRPVESEVSYQERSEPSQVERRSEAPHNQPERRSEVSYSQQESTHAKASDNSKDLLRDLQNTNLPARAGLPENDSFKTVTKGSYLLVFTMVWGLQLFLRALF